MPDLAYRPAPFRGGPAGDPGEQRPQLRLMRDQHVGFLTVYRHGDDLHRVVGVLTDRDIVLSVVAQARPHTERAAEHASSR